MVLPELLYSKNSHHVIEYSSTLWCQPNPYNWTPCPLNQTIETDLNHSSAVVIWVAPLTTDNSNITSTVF